MAGIEPPSFSLGLDLEPEPEPGLPSQLRQHSVINPGPSSSTRLNDDDYDEEDFGLQVMDSDPETGPSSPRVFKRLRRGPAVEELKVKKTDNKEEVFCDNVVDDEIEEFSSQEDVIRDAYPSAEYTSVCSSSKVPLRGSGVLTTQSASLSKEKKRERASDAPSSSCLGVGQNGLIFPKLTISPLRRFQLIDSDSEEPSMNKVISKNILKNNSSLKDHQPASFELKRNSSSEKCQNEDLWKDFHPMQSFIIPTPVLDEVCEEYFQSLQDKNSAQKLGTDLHKGNSVSCHLDTNTITGFEQSWNQANPCPPAHRYFFHDDSRIQSLVRNRLPNFSPLGIVNNSRNHQSSESVINYTKQFDGEASKKGRTQRNNIEKGSTRGRNRSKKSNAKEATYASQGWVDPKSSAAIPKDAGKRRVHANSQATGHWYTSPEGRKVYVSRTGQELTGQMAYRHYKKESGGFRKSKKKTNIKRKKG